MQKLFILGNGFDLMHQLPTKYVHFQNFLRENFEYTPDTFESLWVEGQQLLDGDIVYNEDDVVRVIDSLISQTDYKDSDWNDMERSLGLLDYSLINDDITDVYDKEGTLHPFHTGNNYEDAYSDLKKVLKMFPHFFKLWISSIDIENSVNFKNHCFQELMDIKNDLFLTFNYTETLEILYNAENITHIHGVRSNENSIIVGHGNDDTIGEGAYHEDFHTNEIHNFLRKPTQKIIDENHLFYSNLRNITQIYSIGFSFSEVDLIYVQNLCSNMDTQDITWYLNIYIDAQGNDNRKERDTYKVHIISCGFKGDFDTFELT